MMLASNAINSSQQQATQKCDGTNLSPQTNPAAVSPAISDEKLSANNNHSTISNASGNGISVINDASSNSSGGSSSSTTNTTGVTSTSNLHRQNSSVNACSPNNGSDHSNSSNISSNLTQIIEGTTVEMLHEEKLKKINIKDEDTGKTQLPDKNITSNNSSKVSVVNSLPTLKDDTDLINSLVNIKKEDNLSPNMSPVGFGSIGQAGNSTEVAIRAGTPVKMEQLSGNAPIVNNQNDKLSVSLGLTEDTVSGTHVNNSSSVNDICTNTASVSGTCNISSVQSHSGNGSVNFIGGNGGTAINCMDYMQQQNHIFVFSTQLANKGAESVLSGQFQTIIAYHCTQPATKSFLEEFFIRNPMKMNKLQRQNTLNMCNMSSTVVQPWINHCGNGGTSVGGNNVAKIQQKPNGSKVSFNTNDNVNKSQNLRSNVSSANSFSESRVSDGLNATENEIMCWEHPRNRLESGVADNQAVKLLESAGGGNGGVNVDMPLNVSSLNKGNDTSNNNSDGNIPSLQGVKVPDENLTPQQRQHREEQLAKIKKMNQFLFPENENATQNQINKLTNENNMPSSITPNMVINIPTGAGASSVQTMGNNAMNNSMRSIMLNTCKNEQNTSSGMGDDVLLPNDIIGDIGSGTSMPCSNSQKVGCNSNLTCGTMGVLSNIPNNNIQCQAGANNRGLMSNSPELMGSFAGQNINDAQKNLPLNHEMQSITGGAQQEWTKMQHQFFEDRLKVNKSNGRPNLSDRSVSLTSSGGSNTNQSLRGNSQGPPPPYHPTQRSASVPIATQSPNPASPNNPTSNLSLPSPRTNLGVSSSSPNMVDAATVPNTTSSNSITTSSSTTPSLNISSTITTTKCYQTDSGSPSNRSRGGGGNGSASASGGLAHFNSNPSTPLSHMSPKDLETFNSSVAPTCNSGELKNPRPSPQRPRTPGNTGNLIDSVNYEARFPASSPGLNFNSSLAINSYKSAGAPSNILERQNPIGSGNSTSAQFCRRADNLPLNPNTNRAPQPKINQNFDPISSLAQMSQQLTSCVTGVGGGSGNGGMTAGLMVGPNEINLNSNLDGMLSGMEGSAIDHLGSSGSFGSGPVSGVGSCHPLNSLMNPIGQRMLNPKMCGPNVAGPGFSPVINGPSVRDNIGSSFHGVMTPTTRMMGRMPMNFGNFNVSPNIQVKASTPNTIQYMPVRPQNSNSSSNNNNVRMPPSLEFLQRYANPQMCGGNGGPMTGNENNHIVGGVPMALNASNEQNKLANNSGAMGPGPGSNNAVGMNFFSQNCNQMPNIDEDGLAVGMLPTHDMNLGQPLVRGMRPHGIRQHSMGPRMQAPLSTQQQLASNNFSGPSADGLDCNDPTSMFNTGNGPHQTMFGLNSSQQLQQQQKSLKSLPHGLCQTINSNGSSVSNLIVHGNSAAGVPSLLSNEIGSSGMQQNPHSGSSVMMGVGSTNNNMLTPGTTGGGPSGPCPGANNGSPNNYKSFVGPSSNDLKYAQQYHSFQQQLYATTTRSQPQQQQPGPSNLNMTPNISPNPGFFANK